MISRKASYTKFLQCVPFAPVPERVATRRKSKYGRLGASAIRPTLRKVAWLQRSRKRGKRAFGGTSAGSALKETPRKVFSPTLRTRVRPAREATVAGSEPVLRVEAVLLRGPIVSEESASPGEEWEEVLGLGSEHLWVFRQREGEYPVGELKLAEHAFCVETGNYGRTPNRKEFKYMESNSNQKVCSTVDDTVAEIDSLGEETFFTSNNISIDIPGFPRFSNEFVWKLGAKQLVHWNANCRANEEYNLKTAEERLSLDEIYDLNVGYIVVTSFSVVVAIVIASIDLVKRYSNAEAASAKQHFQQKQLKSAFLIVDIFAKLICVPIIGI